MWLHHVPSLRLAIKCGAPICCVDQQAVNRSMCQSAVWLTARHFLFVVRLCAPIGSGGVWLDCFWSMWDKACCLGVLLNRWPSYGGSQSSGKVSVEQTWMSEQWCVCLSSSRVQSVFDQKTKGARTQTIVRQDVTLCCIAHMLIFTYLLLSATCQCSSPSGKMSLNFERACNIYMNTCPISYTY